MIELKLNERGKYSIPMRAFIVIEVDPKHLEGLEAPSDDDVYDLAWDEASEVIADWEVDTEELDEMQENI